MPRELGRILTFFRVFDGRHYKDIGEKGNQLLKIRCFPYAHKLVPAGFLFLTLSLSSMITRFFSAFLFFAVLSLAGCMEWDYGTGSEEFDSSGEGLFICCEGNFQYGNATLSYYSPSTKTVNNEIFFRTNGMKLGDVAQSMTIHDGKGWIVVNNSHVVFAIDVNSFREVGRIENLPSPRYIHFVSNKKAYVSQLWDNRIAIIDPGNYEITGYISVPGMSSESGSTEQMVQLGKYVYCNCWSYQNRIIKIDTETDRVVDELKIGIQPNSLALDRDGKLWTITDGGYEGSPFGFETPALYKIDAERFEVEQRFDFSPGDSPGEIVINESKDHLYWINGDVWDMDIDSESLPAEPFIPYRSTKYYGLTVAPGNGDVYIGDAIDYRQQGMIHRFSSGGELIDKFYVGISPGAFCWKTE